MGIYWVYNADGYLLSMARMTAEEVASRLDVTDAEPPTESLTQRARFVDGAWVLEPRV
jgi:hypothetical protein